MSDFSDILNMDEISGLAGVVNLPAFSNFNALGRAGNAALAMPLMDDALLDRLTLLKNDMLMLGGVSTSLWMAIENLNPVLQENNAALNRLTAMLAAVPQVFAGQVVSAPSQPAAPEPDKAGDDKDPNYTPAIDPSLDNVSLTLSGALIKGLDSAIIDNATTERFQGLGVSEQVIAQMQALATQEQMKIFGTSEPMDYNALFNFTSNLKSAAAAEADASSLLKASIRVNSISGEHEADIDADASDMSAIDSVAGNLFDPKTHKLIQARADALNNGVANIVLATGGKENTNEIWKMKAGSHVIGQMTSAAGFAALEPIMLALKGVGVGQTLNALDKVFNPKGMSGHEASELKRLGISQASLAKNKTPAQWAAWFETVLDPAMVAHGYKTGAQQKTFLDQILKGNKGLSGLTPLLDKLDEFEGDQSAYQKTAADKTNSYSYITSHNMPLQINAFAAGIEALLGAIAKASTPQALKMLDNLTSILDELTSLAIKYPDISEVIGASLVLDLLGGKALKGVLLGKKGGAKVYKFIRDLLSEEEAGAGGEVAAAKAVKAGTEAAEVGAKAAEAGTKAAEVGAKATEAGTEAASVATKAAEAGTEAASVAAKAAATGAEAASVATEVAATGGDAAAVALTGAAGGEAAAAALTGAAGGEALLTGAGIAALLTNPVGWAALGVILAGAGIYEGYEHRGALKAVLDKLEHYGDEHNEDGSSPSGTSHAPAGEVRFGIHGQGNDDTGSTGGSAATPAQTGKPGKPGSGAPAPAPVAFPPSAPDMSFYDRLDPIGYSAVYGGMYGLDDEPAPDQPWFTRRSASIEAMLASAPQGARVRNQSTGLDYEVRPAMPRAKEIELIADAIGAVLSAQPRYHGAVPVYIVNAGDLHNATVRAISAELDGVQFGPTGYDGSFSMPIPSAHW